MGLLSSIPSLSSLGREFPPSSELSAFSEVISYSQPDCWLRDDLMALPKA